MNFKGVLFDCWDTVIKYGERENNFIIKDFFNEYVDENSKLNVSFEEVLNVYRDYMDKYFDQMLIEVPIESIFTYILIYFHLKLRKGVTLKRALYEIGMRHTPSQIEGCSNFINYLKIHNIKYLVLSNTIHSFKMTMDNIKRCYNNKFIFNKLIVSSEVGVKKYNEDFFKLGCRELNLNPSECIYIGDSFLNDVYGAYRTDFYKACWFNWKKENEMKQLRVDPSKYIEFTSYNELIKLIEEGKI